MKGSKQGWERDVTVRSRQEREGAEVSTDKLFDRSRMKAGIRLFLEGLGSVVPPSVLETTPDLVVEAWAREFLAGYRHGEKPLVTPLAEKAPESLVVISGIRFVSICRHHLLPFQGEAVIAYLPAGRLAGFSAVARLVDQLARRLQIQEELSDQILDRLEESLSPQGTACLLEATHQCMTCRGTAQSESRVTTFRARGVFERDPARRQELLAVLGKAASSGPGDDGS